MKKVKPLKPTVPQILRFLCLLEDEGLGFGAVNTRCALSIILPRIEGETVGKHQLVHWFMRSVYERNPPKPKYRCLWEVLKVFTLLKSGPNNRHLLLKNLSLKVLLLLTTGHKCHTIIALSLDGLDIDKDEATFDLKTLLKSNCTGDLLSSPPYIFFT